MADCTSAIQYWEEKSDWSERNGRHFVAFHRRYPNWNSWSWSLNKTVLLINFSSSFVCHKLSSASYLSPTPTMNSFLFRSHISFQILLNPTKYLIPNLTKSCTKFLFIGEPSGFDNIQSWPTAQWRRHGGEWEGPDPPTSIQTPPEICANPLRSVLYIGGGGVPCMYIVTFYCSPAKKNCSDPPTFFELATPLPLPRH